jgi:Protein of unknown function (DUF3102)
MVKMNVQTRRSDQTATLSNDLAVITAEINAYKRVAGEAIFEIGRRLKDVRDAKLDSQDPRERLIAQQREEIGGWLKWLSEHVEFDRTQAHRLIQTFEQFGDVATSQHLQVGKIFEMLSLPPDIDRAEFVSQPHVIPSTGEVKTVDEMTVRELREVKAELKREREARQRAEAERDQAIESAQVLRDTLESIQEQPQPIREVRTGTEISGRSLEFSGAVRDFIKKYSFLIHFDAEFASMNELSAREYEAAINGMYEFLDALSKRLPSRRGHKPVIINVS